MSKSRNGNGLVDPLNLTSTVRYIYGMKRKEVSHIQIGVWENSNTPIYRNILLHDTVLIFNSSMYFFVPMFSHEEICSCLCSSGIVWSNLNEILFNSELKIMWLVLQVLGLLISDFDSFEKQMSVKEVKEEGDDHCWFVELNLLKIHKSRTKWIKILKECEYQMVHIWLSYQMERAQWQKNKYW